MKNGRKTEKEGDYRIYRLGDRVKPKRVSTVLTTFGPTDEARRDRKMIASGSALLASAILEMRAS